MIYNGNLANFMSANSMTLKRNGIVQLFELTKINKCKNIKLVNNWIKYKLDQVTENHL